MRYISGPTALANDAYGRLVGPAVDRAVRMHPYDSRVSYNPYYVDPGDSTQQSGPAIIDNPYVEDLAAPVGISGDLADRGYGLATGPSRPIGASGISAAPAVFPPELLVRPRDTQDSSGLPFPGAGFSPRQQQALNATAVTEQMRTRQRAASTQWDIITNKAAKEGWTPEQLSLVSGQFQQQFGYSNIPNPISMVETEEDESSPTVKLTRLKETDPEFSKYIQVSPEGKLEVIPGYVQYQANQIKLHEQTAGKENEFKLERRKAAWEEYQAERDLGRERFGADELAIPDPEAYTFDSHYQRDLQDYQQRKQGYTEFSRQLQKKYFGESAVEPGAPNAVPVNPAPSTNPRASAVEFGGIFVNSIDDAIRMSEAGQLKAGQKVFFPDGRSITIPED